MTFVMPPREQVGVLAPEVAGEGVRVIADDGSVLNWTPPPVKPVIPDISNNKAVRKYFGRTGYQTWPSFLYHPVEEPRIVKNAEEAYALGVIRREASPQEMAMYGVKFVWDYAHDSEWRTTPYARDQKVDVTKQGNIKNYMPSAPNPIIAQNALIAELVPKVAEVVAAALLKGPSAPGAPANVDPARWAKFVEFEAWEQSQKAVNALAGEPQPAADGAQAAPTLAGALADVAGELDPEGDEEVAPLGFEDEEAEFAAAKAEAMKLGVKLDKRWGLARIRDEIRLKTPGQFTLRAAGAP